MPSPKRNLVTIENSTIQALLSRADVVAAFPNCLGRVAKLPGGSRLVSCRSCNRKKTDRPDYAKVKSCLASLNGTNRRTLKALLNAKQVRIVHRNAQGQQITFTF
jgi:hypothetical protein